MTSKPDKFSHLTKHSRFNKSLYASNQSRTRKRRKSVISTSKKRSANKGHYNSVDSRADHKNRSHLSKTSGHNRSLLNSRKRNTSVTSNLGAPRNRTRSRSRVNTGGMHMSSSSKKRVVSKSKMTREKLSRSVDQIKINEFESAHEHHSRHKKKQKKRLYYPNIESIRKNQKRLPPFEKSKVIIKEFGHIQAFGVNTHQGTVRNYNEDRVSILLNAQQR